MKQNHICVQYKIIFSNIRVVEALNRLRFVLKLMYMYCKTLYVLWENFCFEKLTQSAVDVTWTLWRKRPIKCIFSCKYLTCILWKPVSQKLVFPCVLYYGSHCDYCVLVQLLLKMCPGGWEVWVDVWTLRQPLQVKLGDHRPWRWDLACDLLKRLNQVLGWQMTNLYRVDSLSGACVCFSTLLKKKLQKCSRISKHHSE